MENERRADDMTNRAEADATLEAAWEIGVRYFDVAPWYGFGLAERRFGRLLHTKKRDQYVLSSKVGKLFKASKNNKHAEIYPLSDSPNDIMFDYSADGGRRSIKDSLQRLGVDALDIARFRRCATKASSGRGASA